MLIALVAGNMIGSGIFLLPASLASVGSISILSWVFTATGAMLVALVFAKMSQWIPKSGGPYAYAEFGFGPFVGIQTAFNYWVALWVGNAAIALALMGYLQVFLPWLSHPVVRTTGAIVSIWLFTIINILGVRRAGMFQLVTTILKLMPLLVVGIGGWFYFHWHNISDSVNLTGHSNFHAFSYGATLTLWAFIGLESATVPAGSVKNPKKTIAQATLWGTLLAAMVYILSSVAIMGMFPMSRLAHSAFPFALAAKQILGPIGQWLIALGAVISCVGALNGWTLLQGQIGMAAADGGHFPRVFAKRNRYDAPHASLIITSVLISILLLMTMSSSLIHQFNLIILTATFASLLPYFYTAMAYLIASQRRGLKRKDQNRAIVLGLLASIYMVWAMVGSGQQIVFYGMLLLMMSLPFYVWVTWGKKASSVV